jgi:hypothetical protein
MNISSFCVTRSASNTGGGGLEATRKAATLAEFRAVVEQECPFVVADTVQDWETTEEKKKNDDTPDEY